MQRAGWLTRLAVLKLTLLVVLAGFYFLVRPWYLGWGATARHGLRPTLSPGCDRAIGTNRPCRGSAG